MVLPDAKNPPWMFPTGWETPLTNSYESSDNAKIFQSVPNLPEELNLNPHKSNNSNETEEIKKPSTSPPPPQIGN